MGDSWLRWMSTGRVMTFGERRFSANIMSRLVATVALLLVVCGFVLASPCRAQEPAAASQRQTAARATAPAYLPRLAKAGGKIGVSTAARNPGSPLTWSQLRTGLYVGTVWVDQVSDGTQDPPPRAVTPPLAPSAGTFQFRIILHIDDVRRVRLVRAVTLMRRKGDGELALVTDPRKFPDFLGVARRDGRLVGVRYAAAAYDFDEPDGNRHPATVTATSDAGTLTFELKLDGKKHPTHPYRHKYHPDLNEAFDVVRSMKIQLFEPAEDERPAYEIERLVGIYSETITGLRRFPLQTAGRLVVHRINQVGRLNE